MAVGMAGVEMIHRYPVERGVQVLLHLRHQSPDHRFQLIIFGAILRRDNAAELVAVAIGPLQESLAVDLISIRTTEHAALALAGRAVPLQLTRWSGRRARRSDTRSLGKG